MDYGKHHWAWRLKGLVKCSSVHSFCAPFATTIGRSVVWPAMNASMVSWLVVHMLQTKRRKQGGGRNRATLLWVLNLCLNLAVPSDRHVVRSQEPGQLFGSHIPLPAIGVLVQGSKGVGQCLSIPRFGNEIIHSCIYAASSSFTVCVSCHRDDT